MRVGQFLPFRYVAPLIIAELHPSSSSRGWVLLAWDRNFPLPIFGVSRRNFFTIWALWPDSQWRPGLRWARFDFSSRCWKGRCDEKLSSDRDVASGALSNIVCWPLGLTLSFFSCTVLSPCISEIRPCYSFWAKRRGKKRMGSPGERAETSPLLFKDQLMLWL